MRKLLFLLPVLALVGCTSFYNATRKAEFATIVATDGAMQSYAAYWKTATNNPAAYGRTLDGLWQERSNVVAIARKVSAADRTVDTALTIYQTNSVTKTAVESALAALLGSAGELETTVELFTGKSKALFTPIK